MPRLGKRAQQLKQTRDSSVKKSQLQATSPNQSSSDHPSTSAAALQVEDAQISSSDTSATDFDSDEALTNDPEAMMEEFVTDWVSSLPRDDLYSLALLLFQVLTQDFQLMITAASKIVAKYVNRSYKTVQKWRVDFLQNKGELPTFLRGRYTRMGSVANDEDLTERARQHVRDSAFN